MNDILPLAINPTEVPPYDTADSDGPVGFYDPALAAWTTALTIARSGILSIDEVAAMLRCSVDTVRRIPVDDLASYDGPGRGVLYLMDDVRSYLQHRKRRVKRRSGMSQPANFRPDPKAGAINPAARAAKALTAGARA